MRKRCVVRHTTEERARLDALVNAGRVAAHKRRHAQILLLVDEGGGGPAHPDRVAAERVGCTAPTVENVRRRCVLAQRCGASVAELRPAGKLAPRGREGGSRRHAWAEGVHQLVEEDFPGAERIALVMDNLNTHVGASLYKAFPASRARQLLNKLEFVYTPKHGSWLNMAEIEFSAMDRQCLNRRLPDIDTVTREATAWAKRRNASGTPAQSQWRFTTEDARIKLHSLYPKISC